MVIAIFGDSCVGKSTIAARLHDEYNATIYTGKDYLRLAKNEAEARAAFVKLLADNANSRQLLIYIITEPAHMALLPDNAIRILVTAPLEIIKERFSARSGGTMPLQIAAMLERKYGAFDSQPHDLAIDNASMTFENHNAAIMAIVSQKQS